MMTPRLPPHQSLDSLVRARLKRWPQRPPGLETALVGPNAWLRGRPGDGSAMNYPYLRSPGGELMRTIPDGMWINFGGTCDTPFADLFAIEACCSLQNLFDKRSRFAASTSSLLVFCPVTWLLGHIADGDETPRWKMTGLYRFAPTLPLTLPVRDMRVMYALKPRGYAQFIRTAVPQAHEYFVPMDALTNENSDQSPALRALVSRASFSANFLPPEVPRAGMELR